MKKKYICENEKTTWVSNCAQKLAELQLQEEFYSSLHWTDFTISQTYHFHKLRAHLKCCLYQFPKPSATDQHNKICKYQNIKF